MSEIPQPISSLRTANRPAVEKLTDWAHPPTLEELRKDLESARSQTSAHIANVSEYEDNLNIRGKSAVKVRKGRSSVQPKLIRNQAEWRYSNLSESILATDKLFTFRPRTFEDTKAAAQGELLLNYQFRQKMSPVPTIDSMVRDITDRGTVALRVGWTQQTEEYDEVVPVYSFYPTTPEQSPDLVQLINSATLDPSLLENVQPDMKESFDYYHESGQLARAIVSGTQTVKSTRMLKNHPTLDVIDSRNLYIDPTCKGRWWEARFMIFTFESSYSELKADGRYKNLEAVNWENLQTQKENGPQNPTGQDANFTDKNRRRVPVQEYYGLRDINGDGVLVPVLVVWVDQVIIRMELNPYPDQMAPFILVPLMPVRDSAYGEPDGVLLADNQRIIGATTRSMIDLVGRAANGQTGMAKQLLDIPNRNKFDQGEDYEFNPTMNPQQHIFTHKAPEIPASTFNMLQYFTNESESLIGQKAFQGGINSSAYGDVAAGVKGIMDATARRESAIVRRIKWGLSIAASKISEMNKMFLSDEEIVRVTNDSDIKVRRIDLQGGVDVDVDITSATENQARAQELSFMLQTMGPNADMDMQKLLLSEIAILRRMPELAMKIQQLQPPQPDPLDQQIKLLEIEKLKSEIQKNNAQAQSFLATAGHKQAQTDLNDQEFVDNQTGRTHQRSLEQQGAQANANQNLEITKSLAKIGEQTGNLLPAALHANLTS